MAMAAPRALPLLARQLRVQNVAPLGRAVVRGMAEGAPAKEAAPGEVPKKLTFSMLQPHELVYDKVPIDMVTLPAVPGVMGILPGHVPTAIDVAPGVITVDEEAGKQVAYFTSGGFAFVNWDSECVINIAQAVPVAELDKEAIAKSLEEYRGQAEAADDEVKKAEAKVSLEIHELMLQACEEHQGAQK